MGEKEILENVRGAEMRKRQKVFVEEKKRKKKRDGSWRVREKMKRWGRWREVRRTKMVGKHWKNIKRWEDT